MLANKQHVTLTCTPLKSPPMTVLALRLRQERSGVIQLRALTVGLLGQDYELVVEGTGFLFLPSQFGSTCSAVQALKSIRLTTL